MKKSTFLWLLFAAAYSVALLQNVLIDGHRLGDGLIMESLGGAVVYWLLSALPVAFQRHGLKWWPSALIFVAFLLLSTIGRIGS